MEKIKDVIPHLDDLLVRCKPKERFAADKAWLRFHPEKTAEWLMQMKKEGFQIHHIDGNHNNDTKGNLLLIYYVDHYKLHWKDIRKGRGHPDSSRSRINKILAERYSD